MLIASHLTRRYGSRTAVDDLSFTLRPGLVTGFLGPNGAGKSTTMRMLLDLERPDSGTVSIGGRPYRALGSPITQIGALIDPAAIHPRRSGRDHLLCLARTHGLGRRRVDEVLAAVGLGSSGTRPAGTLSLGMAQRLGLATALLGDPQILLLDEPVNGLDPDGIIWIRTMLRSLAAEGRTVLVSSHLMSEMALTADHLLVIGRGRLIADETVDAVIARATRSHVVVRSPDPEPLLAAILRAGGDADRLDGDSLAVRRLSAEEVGDLAYAAGTRVHELSTCRASLEDAFLELTSPAREFEAVTP